MSIGLLDSVSSSALSVSPSIYISPLRGFPRQTLSISKPNAERNKLLLHHSLEDSGSAHATAHAHGDHRVASVSPFELT